MKKHLRRYHLRKFAVVTTLVVTSLPYMCRCEAFFAEAIPRFAGLCLLDRGLPRRRKHALSTANGYIGGSQRHNKKICTVEKSFLLFRKNLAGIQDIERVERLLDAHLDFERKRTESLLHVGTFQRPDAVFARERAA